MDGISPTLPEVEPLMIAQKAKEIALAKFAEKFNCAEATLLGLIEAHGLSCDCAPRIATGFGGGIGGCGEACGALVGAVMALGLDCGRERPEDVESKSLVASMVQRLFDEFEREFGSVKCIDLTECLMRTPEGMELAKQRKLHTDFCPKFVAFAAEIASQLIVKQRGD